MKRVIKNIVLITILFILSSCGKKSYVIFDYNCNGSEYHKCELKNNKLNCNIETPACGEYKFKGWYKANEYESPVDLNGTFNKDEIIYARWEKNGQVIESSSQELVSTIIPPDVIDMPSSSVVEEPSSQKPTPEATYTISFNLNGGSGGQSQQISGVKYGNDLPAINQTKPTKAGYTFAGWYDSQTGGTQYYNSSNSPVKKYDKKSNITLYAQFNACPKGQYATSGATSCSACTGNTYTSTTGQSKCSTCATGYKANSDHTGCTANVLTIQYNGNGGTWNNPSKDTYGVNSSGTVIVKSTGQVYSQKITYGSKIESGGLIDYDGLWFSWKKDGYETEDEKEYFLQNGNTKTELDQNKVYLAADLAKYGGCDLSKNDCTVVVEVNWKKSSWSINKDYGTGTWVYHNYNSSELKPYASSTMPFAEYVPSKAVSSGDSLPLIIWLHGYGEIRYLIDENGNETAKCPYSYCLLSSSFLSVTKKWSSTGLKNIPAVMMAPHLQNPGWGHANNTIKAMIKYAKAQYNIDENKIVLIGHSHGGYGVVNIYSSNRTTFSALVIMSGSVATASSSYAEDLKKMPVKGYSESNDTGNTMKSFFKSIGKLDDLTLYDYNETTHGQVPKRALTEDKNNDKVSDLIYWALIQTKK